MSTSEKGEEGKVLLVGSVPLATVSEVYEVCGRELGASCARFPDGEAAGWVHAPAATLSRAQGLERQPEAEGGRFRIAAGVSAGDVRLAPTGYVEGVLDSYKKFVAARAAGKMPEGARFQASFPTPLAILAFAVAASDVKRLLPVYEAHLFAELKEILSKIPARDLAVQWDCAVEIVGVVERVFFQDIASHIGVDEAVAGVARAVAQVPADVQVGVHLCYGNRDGKHAVEPKDTANMTAFANALFAQLKRPLTWLHMPVPIARNDESYFAPLAQLKKPEGCEFYLGLVHPADGVDGAMSRIKAGKKFVASFGVGTECGLRFFPTADIPDILRLHRAAASASA
jgi:hypothetical protein